MVPSKPKKEESRRSSILKPQKSRQPLQKININSSSNEDTPATSKVKRRVSFAEKKHVKEFCHSTEQGTVWDNTYEEHDSSLKASFRTDQNTKVESKENASKVTSKGDYTAVGTEANSSHRNDFNLTDSQPHASAIEFYENDKDNDLNPTNPIEHVEIFSQKLLLGQTILSNVSKSTSSNIVTVYVDNDKENDSHVISNEYCPEICTNKVGSEMERTCIQDQSMELTMMIPTSSVNCDIEDNKQKDTQKDNVASHQDFDTNYTTMEMTKVASWRNKTEIYDPISKQENMYERKDMNNSITFTERTRSLHKSMDITETVSVPSYHEKMYNIEHAVESLVPNCNNEPIEITQAISRSVEPIKSDLEVSRKISVIMQNCTNKRRDTTSNSSTSPINLQATKNIVSKRIQNDYSSSHLMPDNSIKLTSVIQSRIVADSDTFNPNDNKNNTNFNTSMEMTIALPSKIYKQNATQPCNKSAVEENSLKENCETEGTDKTEFFNDVPMEMTRPISMYEKNIPYFHDEDTVSGKHLRKNRKISENSDKTEFFNDAPMQMTRPINVILPMNVYDKENLRTDELMFGDNKNTFSQNTSIEMTKTISSRNGREIFNPIIRGKNICETENENSITFSERTKLLCKSMDITEAVPDPWLHEKMCNIENTAKFAEALISRNTTTPRTHLPEENSARLPLQTESAVNNDETIHNASMEITAAGPSIMHHIGNIKLHRTENLSVSRSNEFQRPTANDVTEFRKSEIRENVTIPRETVGTTNLHSASSNTRVLTNNFNYSLSSTLTNALLHESMGITKAVPSPFLHEETCNIKRTAESLISRNTTTPRTHLFEENSARLPLQTESAINNDETIHNASMGITAAVPSITHHIGNIKLHRTENLSVSRSNEFQRPTANDVTEFRKSEIRENVTIPRETVGTTNLHSASSNTRVLTNNFNYSLSSTLTNALLHESMDITKAVPSPFLHEETCNIKRTAESLISRNTTTPRTHLPEENSAKSSLQTEPNNKTIHDTSMEVTAAVPSAIRHIENITLNGTESLDVSKRNEFPRPVTNNVTELKKSEIRENVTIPREIVETTNLHNASSNNTRVLTNNFDHSSSVTLTNVNRKRRSHEDESTNAKKFRSDSLEESQPPVCHNIHSSSDNDDKHVKNERSTEDTIDPTQISKLPCGSNVNDSLNNIDDCSFLKKNLENSLVELQSINPPSFVYMSEDENSLFEGILWEDKPHVSIDTVPINNKNINSQRLETTDVEQDETKDCHRSAVTNAIEHNRETDGQARTIIDDNLIDESNRHATDREHLDGGESASNVNRRKTATLFSIDHFTETKVTRKDQEEREMDEEEYTLDEVNNDEVELPNIEQEQCIEVREEVERHIDHLKETEAIFEDEVNLQMSIEEDQGVYCQEHSNGKINQQGVEQKEDYVEKRLDAKQCSNETKEEPLVEQDPFLSLSQKIEALAEGENCIWNVYYKNVDRKMIAFGFMSNSLLIITFLSDNLSRPEENLINEIKIISRLADDADVLIKIVHGLILEKINVETFTHSYSTHEDVLSMLDLISQEVKLAMNFMFDLKRLDDLNLMEIARDKISFVSRSKCMNIILKITINVKRFDKLTPNDVNIHCLLGTIKETDIKKLIKNVKKNHKFLSRYMNDVKNYIDIMEEISTTPG
ncbi:PREDICTED: uncharacterized protein LOC106745306 [Dinoponera quadriceps]|uniref:Uncharacterized protein LOC106745306 n=1 Tax=Dinoponera quadriceps TaxID=609295 RepID=A0A6P3XDG7_DINQU|nr:PREDICTED: uncharacterized protein LOC106745306 [Dinoponera quadriceps]